jgi:aryl-alcohol dehydrogenase-like predicted oxidoreductase
VDKKIFKFSNFQIMDYNLLGKTSLRLSNLSFGASSLGGVFHSLREADGIKAVHAAVDGGMNFIDVSPYYGFYKAETVLGKALQEIPRSQYYLSTKVGRYGNDGVKTWDYSAAKAQQSVYESMERLHVDYLDIVHVHDIEFSDMNVVVNETLPALAELRTQGVVRHVGITDLQLANLKWVLDRTPAGLVECVLNFCHYCLCDDALADYLDYFEGKGVGVINASPLSMGMLSSRGMPDWHPAPKLLVALCAKAMVRCADRGYPIEKLAMQYAVSNPRITTTLFSTTNPDNVRKNLQWISEPLDHELLAEVRRIISPQARVTWANS